MIWILIIYCVVVLAILLMATHLWWKIVVVSHKDLTRRFAKRQIYIDHEVHTITHSEFRDGDEWVKTWTEKNGHSLGWLRLKDVIKE